MSTITSHSPLNISETLEIEAWFQRTTIGNGLWGIKWSRDRWRHMTPIGQTRDPNMLRAQYLENNWRCYLATIANYQIVCCEAVRSAILAAAWLLVYRGCQPSAIELSNYRCSYLEQSAAPWHGNTISASFHECNALALYQYCNSVCLLVQSSPIQYCVQTAKPIVQILSPPDSPHYSSFLRTTVSLLWNADDEMRDHYKIRYKITVLHSVFMATAPHT